MEHDKISKMIITQLRIAMFEEEADSFCEHLISCWLEADDVNKERLISAYPELSNIDSMTELQEKIGDDWDPAADFRRNYPEVKKGGRWYSLDDVT